MAHRRRRFRLPPLPACIAAGLVLLLLTLVLPLPRAALDGPAVTSIRVLDRSGILLREIRPEGRARHVDLASVGTDVVDALLATEDRFFFMHPGVNPLALARAAWQSVTSGDIVSGGSTITMQVARTLRGRTSRPIIDKLAEMHLALRLELRLSKHDILSMWLNRVPFGNQAFGIEAAARTYFGKSAADLSTAEATYLIGLPQSPGRYDPFRHPERARARHLRVLRAMERHGRWSPEDVEAAAALELDVLPPTHAFRAPHFTTWVASMVPADDRVRDVRTTLDARLQEEVESIVTGHLRELRRQDVSSAAVVVVHNATGDVLAYVGSSDFWDDRNGGQNDGVRMARQPGSALKPFTYAHAFATRRYAPATIVADIETQIPEAGGAFSPQNYDKRFRGPVPVREALAGSYNVPAVRLARELGPEALLVVYRDAGFATLDGSADFYGVGLTLGNGEVRLLDLARAYAGLARGGVLPPIRSVDRVSTREGDRLVAPLAPERSTSISPAVAYLLTDILRDPEARAQAFGRGGPLELPFPVAAKTGTTKDYRDNWAIGYSPTHTVAVWAGNFDGRPMRWVSGVSGAAPIMKSIFLTIGSGGEFRRPGGVVDAVVCPASGRLPGSHCPSRRTDLFLSGTIPNDTCDVHQRIRLDARSGMLAAASTPGEDVIEQTYTVYPPEYHAWMMEHNLPLPPQVSAAAFAEKLAASADRAVYSDELVVVYPESGTVYQLDPVLRLEHQRVHLRGRHTPAVSALQWWIDGRPLEEDFRGASMALTAGRHEIELRGLTTDGRVIRSVPSVIRVSAPRRASTAISASRDHVK